MPRYEVEVNEARQFTFVTEAANPDEAYTIGLEKYKSKEAPPRHTRTTIAVDEVYEPGPPDERCDPKGAYHIDEDTLIIEWRNPGR